MKIETKRLIITEFDMNMAESVHINSLDEDNRRFVPDEVFETVEEAAETVEFLIGVYENGNGPLVYPVLLKDGTYIGYVQAVPFDNGTWEVGYHIGGNYTKQGYATEAVTAFLFSVVSARARARSMARSSTFRASSASSSSASAAPVSLSVLVMRIC